MSDPVNWQGSPIEVKARLIPRFFWTTASIDVFLGKQCILRTGGQMKATGAFTQEFTHSGATHMAELTWGVGYLYSFPYQLRIDGVLLGAGRVRVQNWAFGLILSLVLLGLLGLLLLYLHHHWPPPVVEIAH